MRGARSCRRLFKNTFVMPGFMPGIHDLARGKESIADGRAKPGHDEDHANTLIPEGRQRVRRPRFGREPNSNETKPTSLMRTKRVHWSLLSEGRSPMRSVIASGLVLISLGFLVFPAPVHGRCPGGVPLQGLRLQGRLGLARPRRVLRVARQARRGLRHAGGHAVQAGGRAPRLLRQVAIIGCAGERDRFDLAWRRGLVSAPCRS